LADVHGVDLPPADALLFTFFTWQLGRGNRGRGVIPQLKSVLGNWPVGSLALVLVAV
jgi:hypothetical protein